MATDLQNTYYNLSYDIATGEVNHSFWGKQGDTGNGLEITLFENGLRVIPSNEVIFFNATKPDGKRVWYASETVNGRFYIRFSNQLYAVSGLVQAELDVVTGGKTRKSETFRIDVRKAESNNAIDSVNHVEALVLKSPNGTAYKLTVSDAGIITTTIL